MARQFERGVEVVKALPQRQIHHLAYKDTAGLVATAMVVSIEESDPFTDYRTR